MLTFLTHLSLISQICFSFSTGCSAFWRCYPCNSWFFLSLESDSAPLAHFPSPFSCSGISSLSNTASSGSHPWKMQSKMYSVSPCNFGSVDFQLCLRCCEGHWNCCYSLRTSMTCPLTQKCCFECSWLFESQSSGNLRVIRCRIPLCQCCWKKLGSSAGGLTWELIFIPCSFRCDFKSCGGRAWLRKRVWVWFTGSFLWWNFFCSAAWTAWWPNLF